MPNDRRKCSYQFPNGRFCRRWADRGQRFCHHHQPWAERHEPREMETLHPLERLVTVEDLFDVVREALNAARLGRISPGQAYAVGYLAQLWLQVRKELSIFQRNSTLRRQLIPELAESEDVADEAVSESVPEPPTPSSEEGERPGPAEQAEAESSGASTYAEGLQEALHRTLQAAMNGRGG